MSRFIKETDYAGNIKAEIKKLITNTTSSTQPSQAQIRAEDTAISTITEYLGGRYDCVAIFQPHIGNGADTRNLHIVKIVLALALYDLYHQTGMRDIPEHRKTDYDDAISWLKDVGRGTVKSTLPTLVQTPNEGEIRWDSKPKRNHKW